MNNSINMNSVTYNTNQIISYLHVCIIDRKMRKLTNSLYNIVLLDRYNIY